jgi:hypothetical protein
LTNHFYSKFQNKMTTPVNMSEKIQSLLSSQNTDGTDIWISILHTSHTNPTKEFESTFMKPLLEQNISPYFLSFLSNRKLEKYSEEWNYQPKMLSILLMTKQMFQQKKTEKLTKDEFMEIEQPIVEDIVQKNEIKEEEIEEKTQEFFEEKFGELNLNQSETLPQESEEIKNEPEKEEPKKKASFKLQESEDEEEIPKSPKKKLISEILEEFQVSSTLKNNEIFRNPFVNIGAFSFRSPFSFQNEEFNKKFVFPEMKTETIENSIIDFN